MANFIYPNQDDLLQFVKIVKENNFKIGAYFPNTDKKWYETISESIMYVQQTEQYEKNITVHDISARLLYKVAKRHELGDGNKRSAVITVYLFSLLNDYLITNPEKLKVQAKRIASTKGRLREELMKKRISNALKNIIIPLE